jgi:hypothetical protein
MVERLHLNNRESLIARTLRRGNSDGVEKGKHDFRIERSTLLAFN